MTDKAADGAGTRRRMPPRSHSNFAARTANDDSHQLDRRSSVFPSPSPNEETPLLSLAAGVDQQHHGAQDETHQERDHGIDAMREWFSKRFSISGPKSTKATESKRPSDAAAKPRPGAFPRPVGGTGKLGTFAGVFVPTTLNVLSILMFLRFGFILGQAGVVGMMGKCAIH